MDKTCLSYWFPKLVAAGVPVPLTKIVRADCEDLTCILYGKTPDGFASFIALLTESAKCVSRNGPWFLRTGQTSGKHNWKRTCFVTDLDLLPHHVAELVEFSHMVDFLGLDHDVWVVREMLPTKPIANLPRYGDMPLVREMRCFVRGGAVVCCHDYWPEGAIADGLLLLPPHPTAAPFDESFADRDQAKRLYELSRVDDRLSALALAERVAKTFADDGAWSVDVLETENGWYVTDMAEAHRSFHWDGCHYAVTFAEKR